MQDQITQNLYTCLDLFEQDVKQKIQTVLSTNDLTPAQVNELNSKVHTFLKQNLSNMEEDILNLFK
jgi:hypothetical protein